MPRTRAEKSTPTKARVSFSDNSSSNTTPATKTSSNTETTPSTSAVDTADDMIFRDTLNKIFSKKLLALLTGKDAILKEVRDCVLGKDEDRLKEISPYIYSYWRDLSVKHGCLCINERIEIPKAIKDTVLEDIPSTQPGSFAMRSLAQNIWCPYIQQDILAKASECKACTEIGKKVKPVILHSKWSPLTKCIELNDEIQFDIGGPIIYEKGIEMYSITSVDRYSIYPKVEIEKNAFSTNVFKFPNNLFIISEYLEQLD